MSLAAKVAEDVGQFYFCCIFKESVGRNGKSLQDGKKCQKHAIFRPDWHTAKTRANCCFSHVSSYHLPSLFVCVSVCTYIHTNIYDWWCVCVCVCVCSVLRLYRSSMNCCSLPGWYHLGFNTPPTSFPPLCSIRSARRFQQGSRNILEGRKKMAVSGPKMASIWIFCPQIWCNIRRERHRLSGTMCQRACGHNRNKKHGEYFSWSAAIFKPDNQNIK